MMSALILECDNGLSGITRVDIAVFLSNSLICAVSCY